MNAFSLREINKIIYALVILLALSDFNCHSRKKKQKTNKTTKAKCLYLKTRGKT